MAPEIFERDYSWEADMWSVGMMLYQLYARRFPFWDTYEACRTAKLEEVAQLVLVSEGATQRAPQPAAGRLPALQAGRKAVCCACHLFAPLTRAPYLPHALRCAGGAHPLQLRPLA